MSSLINTGNLWSDLFTKVFLTVHAEDLACSNLDKKIIHNGRRHNKPMWCVLKKLAGEEGEQTITNF